MLKEAVKVGKYFHANHVKKSEYLQEENRRERLVKEQYKGIKCGVNLPSLARYLIMLYYNLNFPRNQYAFYVRFNIYL
jgi:hypothetical protein